MRFNGLDTLIQVENFLLFKRKEIKEGIEKGIYHKGRGYASIATISNILRLDYFGKERMNLTVFELLEILKEDYNQVSYKLKTYETLKKRQAMLQIDIKTFKKRLKNRLEDDIQEDFETSDYREILKEKEEELSKVMLQLKQYPDDLDRTKKTIHAFMGILQRKDGYFGTIKVRQ